MANPFLFQDIDGYHPDPVFPDGVFCLSPTANSDLAFNLDQTSGPPFQTILYRNVDGVWARIGQQTLQNNSCLSASLPVPAYYTRETGWPESPVNGAIFSTFTLFAVFVLFFLFKWVIHGVLKTL